MRIIAALMVILASCCGSCSKSHDVHQLYLEKKLKWLAFTSAGNLVDEEKLRRAFSLYDLGDYTNAAILLMDTLSPTSSLVQQGLLLAVFGGCQDSDAVHMSVQRLAEFDSDITNSLWQVASAFAEQEPRARAIGYYSACAMIFNEPQKRADAWFNAGVCADKSGARNKAEEYYGLALKSSVKHEFALGNRALLHLKSGKRDVALKELRKALDLVPESLFIKENYASVLAQAGQKSQAIKLINEVLSIEPSRQFAKVLLEQIQR